MIILKEKSKRRNQKRSKWQLEKWLMRFYNADARSPHCHLISDLTSEKENWLIRMKKYPMCYCSSANDIFTFVRAAVASALVIAEWIRYVYSYTPPSYSLSTALSSHVRLSLNSTSQILMKTTRIIKLTENKLATILYDSGLWCKQIRP